MTDDERSFGPMVDSLLAAGRRDMVEDVLESFLETTHERRRRLVDAAGNGDLEGLTYVAHALRGSVLSVGGDETGSVFRQIESYAREGRLPELRELLPRALASLEGDRDRVAAWLERHRDVAPGANHDP